jgi:hypothetical protein
MFDKSTGQFVKMLGASTHTGSAQQLQSPLCVAVDNNHVYVTDGATNRVQIYDKENGGFVRQVGGCLGWGGKEGLGRLWKRQGLRGHQWVERVKGFTD